MKIFKSNEIFTMDKLDELKELARAYSLARECSVKMQMEDVSYQIEFSSRMTSTLGRAWTYRKKRCGKIKLSSVLWLRCDEAERIDTIIHEVAHVLTNIKYGYSCGHNRLWKQTMVVLGGNPKRCHNIDVSDLRRATKRLTYMCPYCSTSFQITKNLRTRWVRGKQTRLCRNCRGRLHWELVT